MWCVERDSFIIYRSFCDAITDLPPEDGMKLFKAVCAYALDWVELELDGVVSTLFKLIKPQLDANRKRYINGCAGWRPPKTWDNSQKPNDNQTESKPEGNVNDNHNVNENVNENENTSMLTSVWAKPTRKKKVQVINNYSPDFNVFWATYPKRKGKARAWDAWLRCIDWWLDPGFLTSKASDYARECVLKHVEDRYIKRPQWWLNDARYDDDFFTGRSQVNLDDIDDGLW